MTEKKNRPLANGVTRRAFVTQITAGAAGAALALSAADDLLAAVAGSPSAATAAARPRAGALYYPWYRHDGTNWNRHASVPALGLYDSSDLGVIDTHVTWTLEAQLDFLLVAQDGNATAANTATLFARSAKRELDLGLMLVAGDEMSRMAGAHAHLTMTRQHYVDRAAAALRARLEAASRAPELRLPNYLKDRAGRPVIAVRGWDTADVMAEIVGKAARNRDVAIWTIPELAEQEWQACAAYGSKVVLASAAAASPSALAQDAGYVVVDSFNDWRRGTTLEPTVAEGRTAPARLATLRTTLGIS